MPKTMLIFSLWLFLCAESSAQDTMGMKSIHDIAVSAYFNHLNYGSSYGMGIASAYYKNMYAEARYNYEDLQTFSFFGGYAFSNDRHAINWEIIPMAGFAIGNTRAIIPALNINLDYRNINLSSQTEYAITIADKSSSFLYTWSEFSYNFFSWLGPGLVVQRSKLYRTGRVIDRGFMINSEFLPKLTATAYLFDPFDETRRFFVAGINYSF